METDAASRVVHGPAVAAPTLRRRSAVGEIPPRLPRPRLPACEPSLTSSPVGLGQSEGPEPESLGLYTAQRPRVGLIIFRAAAPALAPLVRESGRGGGGMPQPDYELLNLTSRPLNVVNGRCSVFKSTSDPSTDVL